MNKLIITAAINGSHLKRDKNINIPYSPDEIAEESLRVYNSGASIVHIHARDINGNPSYNSSIYKEILNKIRDRCPILINFSTSNLFLENNLDIKESWNHLQFYPDIVSLNLLSMNHHHKVFINDPINYVNLIKEANDRNVKLEIEVYNGSEIDEALYLKEKGIINDNFMLFNFALGIKGGMNSSIESILYLKNKLNDINCSWSCLGIGKGQLTNNLYSILLGGNVRTGFEDNLYYRYKEKAKDNAQLVDRIVRLSKELNREIATVEETKEILKLNINEYAK